MRDAMERLDAYLGSCFGLSLEQLLADATAGAGGGAGPSIQCVCDPVGCFSYEDGGRSEQYQGLLTIEGLTYRFRCAVFVDGGGARFLETIGELEPVRWGVRVALPRRGGAAAAQRGTA
jgi:hypothetical protein